MAIHSIQRMAYTGGDKGGSFSLVLRGSTPRGEAYRRRQGLPVSLHLHQWLTTVGGPILTFSVTADGSFGRFGGPLARPCKQQLVARCVRHCVFWPKPVKENVASDGG